MIKNKVYQINIYEFEIIGTLKTDLALELKTKLVNDEQRFKLIQGVLLRYSKANKIIPKEYNEKYKGLTYS